MEIFTIEFFVSGEFLGENIFGATLKFDAWEV